MLTWTRRLDRQLLRKDRLARASRPPLLAGVLMFWLLGLVLIVAAPRPLGIGVASAGGSSFISRTVMHTAARRSDPGAARAGKPEGCEKQTAPDRR